MYFLILLEVLGVLHEWNRYTSELLTALEEEQEQAFRAHEANHPAEPALPWEPSKAQLERSARLGEGIQGEGGIDRAGYAYMQTLFAAALHPGLSKEYITESAADDFVGDAAQAEANGIAVIGQYLPVRAWSESLLELATVWCAARATTHVINFLERLRDRVGCSPPAFALSLVDAPSPLQNLIPRRPQPSLRPMPSFRIHSAVLPHP